jgi:hypothetical protein
MSNIFVTRPRLVEDSFRITSEVFPWIRNVSLFSYAIQLYQFVYCKSTVEPLITDTLINEHLQ